MVDLEKIEDLKWFKEGLRELGLDLSNYKQLSAKHKQEVDDCLREMGHLW